MATQGQQPNKTKGSRITLSAADLVKPVSDAMRPGLAAHYAAAEAFAKTEAAKIAHTLANIIELRAVRAVEVGHARELINIQRSASLAVFLTVEGVDLSSAQIALKDALGVVREAVNLAVGFDLL